MHLAAGSESVDRLAIVRAKGLPMPEDHDVTIDGKR
jgi:hypothetical protein